MKLVLLLRAAVVAGLAVGVVAAGPAHAQQGGAQPTAAQAVPPAAAIAAARELITIKGGMAVFDPIVPGVIEFVKNSFLPTNPNLSKELEEVTNRLRKDFDGKRAELLGEIAQVYASKFTEAELKELIAFYKSPLGKKMAMEEPAAIDQSMKQAQVWADKFALEVMGRFRDEMKKKGHDL